MENTNNSKKKAYGSFWHGFLISLAAWIVDTVSADLLLSWALYNRNSPATFLSILTNMIIPLGIILGMIWLPIAIIAGFMTRKKGWKSPKRLVLITLIIAFVLVGCGATIVFGLAG